MTLLIDSAHVYSTLWRTYLDKSELLSRKKLYFFVPVICFFILLFLAFISLSVLLSVSAYVAIVHFIRQQYGWMMIASAKSGMSKIDRTLDKMAMYSVTLYPIIWCHMVYSRSIATGWYFKGDLLLGVVPN